jgi:spore coat protein U-like protein
MRTYPVTASLRRTCAASAALLAAFVPGVVQAATSNSSMPVSATVQATCSITASPLAFGTYSSAQLDATTTLAVNCTNTTSYNVGLDIGSGSGATVAQRKMANGSQTLNYTVYSDIGRATLWGPTVGTNTVAGTGSGSVQILNVYGRIAAGQAPTPGSYADTLTATVTY